MLCRLYELNLPQFSSTIRLLTALVAFSILAATGPHSRSAMPIGPPAPQVGKPAPPFKGLDANGKTWKLTDLHGRPAALFFYCGCDACIRCAREWASFQRSGTLDAAPFGPDASKHPLTVIVLSGDAAAVRSFARETGTLPTDTVLIADDTMHATNLYGVAPCPRVFVVAPNGILRYTNNRKDDAPQHDTEKIITARALTALRASIAPTLTHTGPTPARK